MSKHKKRKRKHSVESLEDADQQLYNENSHADNDTILNEKLVDTPLKTKSKKKKHKQNDSVCVELKKESESLTDINSLLDNADSIGHLSKKKKKKKCKKTHCDLSEGVNGHALLQSDEDSCNEGEIIQNKMGKKRKKTIICEPMQNGESKRKKEKNNKVGLESLTELSCKVVVDDDTTTYRSQKKNKVKKKKNNENESKMTECPGDEVENETHYIHKKKKEKKKDKKCEIDSKMADCSSNVENETHHDRKKRKKKKIDDSTDGIEFIKNDEQSEKKKKKHKHDEEHPVCGHDGNHGESLVTMNETLMAELETGKKVKKDKTSIECEMTSTDLIVQTGHKKSKKNKAKEEEKKSSDILENSIVHKTKKKEMKVEKSREISEHLNISNGRNENSQTDKSVPNSLGQWGTASLGNDGRQQKFLRLLGGFKKGGNSSSTGLFGNVGAKPKSSNLALNHQQEETLNTNLMSSFQKALDYKLYKAKGVGLGFAPPPGEGKKFHIDTDMRKSHKFDD